MNGWSALLLTIVVIVVVCGVAWTLRADAGEACGLRMQRRRLRLIQIAGNGSLSAVIALAAPRLGLGGVAFCGLAALGAARLLRAKLILGSGPAPWRFPWTLNFALAAGIIVPLFMSALALAEYLAEPLTRTDLDSALFGEHLLADRSAATRVVDHPPTLADAAQSGAAAGTGG